MNGKLVACLAFLAVGFNACGPVFKTNYTYIPPKTSQGQACVFQCQNTQQHCEQLEEMRYERCLDRNEADYYRCLRDQRYVYNYKKGRQECVENCYCSRGYCSRDEERCGEQYRGCYQTCGGEVLAETICVSNCEQLEEVSS